ncbi:MAG: hypothetical protein IJW24_01975 [Clostridia bacterium]|nr:hypothetical protein [Clostridia bacterium]
MSLSLTILTILILLVMFGAGQRVLDQMRLNDKQALLLLVLMVIGIIIPPIYITEKFCFSIGGFVIPFGIAVYLLVSCGWSRDLLRAILGTVLVAGFCLLFEWILPADPEEMIVDPMFVYGAISGIVAYTLGRSRRNAFVSAVFGITLSMVIQFVINQASGIAESVLGLGVGGAFGTLIVAVLISVALAEFLGRMFETAKPDQEKKEFNYDTHTYDSEKNGKLSVAKSKDKQEKTNKAQKAGAR